MNYRFGANAPDAARKRMTNRFIFGVACIAMSLSAYPCAAGSNPFLGEIETFAFNFCPLGWAALNGQLLPISQNTALFSLLGTTYGGDGVTTFALPTGKPVFTLTPGAPAIQCIATQGIFPSRS